MLLKMILRSWSRNPLNTYISLASLTLGIACSLLLLMFYLSEVRIVKTSIKQDNLYVMLEQDKGLASVDIMKSSTNSNSVITIGDAFGEVEKYSYLVENRAGDYSTDVKKSIYLNKGKYFQTTPEICDMMHIPVIEGDLRRTLCSSSEIAITYGTAMDFFGTTDNLIGRTLVRTTYKRDPVTSRAVSVVNNYTVTAILDDSQRAMFQGIALLSSFTPEQRTALYGEDSKHAYAIFQLREGVIAQDFTNIIKADTSFCSKALDNQTDFAFRSLEDVYFASEDDVNFKHSIFNSREPATLITGVAIALVLLVISAFNYVNITLTRASDRLKCIAGQRIMGATRMSVRWQTILDTTLQVLLSFGLALLLLDQLAINEFNSFMNADISTADILRLDVAAASLGLVLLLILTPSLYILVKMEVRNPLEVFLSSRKRKVTAARNIVIVQFAVATIMVIVGLNIWRQTNYICQTIKNSNHIYFIQCNDTFSRPIALGLDENGLSKRFVDLIASQASVKAITNSWLQESYQTYDNEANCSFAQIYINPGVLDFYGLNLIHGRDYVDTDQGNSAIVNEALLRAFDVKPPYIGEVFRIFEQPKTIIGVVEDFKYSNVKQTIEPLMLVNSYGFQDSYRHVVVKYSGTEDSLRSMVADNWKAMYPDRPQLTVSTMQHNILQANPEVMRMGIMVGVFTVVSLLLALMGLFGISWYTVQSRRREIAIRKVFGANRGLIVTLLCGRFFKWILVAVVVAVPTAYFASGWWLEGFAYRVTNSILVIVISVFAISLLTLLTVLWQSVRAASTNPADVVKTE